MLLRLFQILSLLPLPVLHALGTVAGWVVYFSSPGYRRRMREHLALAGHDDLLHQAIAEAGKGVLELPFIWCAPPSRVLGSATIHDWEVAQSALEAGRGVIFLSPHLGCFEIIAQVIASRVPLTAMYRRPKKAALEPLLGKARGRDGLSLTPANLAGVRTLLKRLRGGGAIGLLPDQVPGEGEGVWAPFFGRPAYTMTLPAKLQQMSGAPLVLSYAERLPRGRGFAIHFVRFDQALEGTPAQQAQAINAAMESLIARCPAQYFWSYNRFKGTPVADVPSGEPA
jgi:KDO2-lipid IV(A) lauroyltransferase